MDDSNVEDALDRAEERFQNTRGQTSEPGLDMADTALIQLRKACRLLEAARTLRERNGFYTVVIEASFVAIERSLNSISSIATPLLLKTCGIVIPKSTLRARG